MSGQTKLFCYHFVSNIETYHVAQKDNISISVLPRAKDKKRVFCRRWNWIPISQAIRRPLCVAFRVSLAESFIYFSFLCPGSLHARSGPQRSTIDWPGVSRWCNIMRALVVVLMTGCCQSEAAAAVCSGHLVSAAGWRATAPGGGTVTAALQSASAAALKRTRQR